MDSSTILFVDIGNTHINLEHSGKYYTFVPHELSTTTLPRHTKAIISNNTALDIAHYFTNPIITVAAQQSGITFDYDISSLGIDRYHSIVAAHYAYSRAIIIDVGTAITVDKIETGVHTSLGIAPGFERLCSSFVFATEVSNAQLNIGSHHMLLAYVHDIIVQYSDYPIIITGGDSERTKELASTHQEKFIIHYKRNMVIDGLKFYYQTFLSDSHL